MLSIQTKFSGTAAKQLSETAKRLRANTKKMALAAGRLLRTNIATEVDRFAENPTGALADSFVVLVGPSKEGETPKAQVTIESTKPYAGIHERGGIIRPRNSKYLAIPLTPMARKIRPRMWGGRLFGITSKRGNRLLVTRRAGGGVKPQFLLRRSVRIKKKAYVTKALARSRPMLRNLMAIQIRASLNRVSR